MVDDLKNLRLLDEEEDAFQEDAKEMERDIEFSLVGTYLTNSVLLVFSKYHDGMDFRYTDKERESMVHSLGYSTSNSGGYINHRNPNINDETLFGINKGFNDGSGLNGDKVMAHKKHLEVRLRVLAMEEPTNETLSELPNIQLKLNLEVDKKELCWEQKVHINWLKHGDHNTTFFHKLATGRKCHNSIKGLEDEAGRWIEDENGVMAIVSNNFQDIFTALEGEVGATFDKVQ
ncbi:hypothetical protein PVK06_020534 [Gossypium arboreum]|uniref:Uncharacterized protein n=1 Tax=Gossypium arboreum TaxID=29729 RepID=A0ABR0PML7_GOSAR|nr:hypothetical protein PVK06_020534 [Gossypium arboreum]